MSIRLVSWDSIPTRYPRKVLQDFYIDAAATNTVSHMYHGVACRRAGENWPSKANPLVCCHIKQLHRCILFLLENILGTSEEIGRLQAAANNAISAGILPPEEVADVTTMVPPRTGSGRGLLGYILGAAAPSP